MIELLTETRELAQLANFVRESEDSALEGVSHHVTEPAAIVIFVRDNHEKLVSYSVAL